MTLPQIIPHEYKPRRFRKFLWLLLLATLWIVTLSIIPRVPTPRPAIDSKLLTLRVMLCPVFLLTVLNWRLLVTSGWRFVDTIFGLLLAAFALSTVFSDNVLYSITESWQAGGLIAAGWVIYRLALTANECRSLLWVAGTLGLLASLYGFLTYIGADILRPLYPFEFEEDQAGGRNYIHSFFGNPEYFGGFAAPAAVILWGLAFQPGTKLLSRVALAGATAFILLVLGLSGSRGAFLGFMAGAVVIFGGQIGFLTPRTRKAAWLILATGTVALAIAVTILSVPNPLNPRDMRLLQRFTSLADTQTASVRERLVFYTSTTNAIPDNPIFGFGPGTYRLEFLNNMRRLVEQDPRAGTTIMLQELDRRLAEHAHNDYLEIWFEQGTLGLAAFLLLLTYGGVRFVKLRWHARRFSTAQDSIKFSAGLYVTIFAGVLTITINALTSFPLHMPARGTLVWLLIGAFFALDQRLHEALRLPTGITPLVQPPTKDETK